MAKKDNQKKFLTSYENRFGNITLACKDADINRGTYYAWINGESQTDTDFRTDLAAIEPEERFVDFLEDALKKRISAGDTTAIIFALKTKGKKRGYVERSEMDVNANINLKSVDEFNKESEARLKATEQIVKERE